MTYSVAFAKFMAASVSDEAEFRQAAQDFEQAKQAHHALIVGRLVQLGLDGADVDAVVDTAPDVWREAFESLREAYCTLWSTAQETGEQDSPDLQAVESTLILLLDLCRQSARRLDEQGA